VTNGCFRVADDAIFARTINTGRFSLLIIEDEPVVARSGMPKGGRMVVIATRQQVALGGFLAGVPLVRRSTSIREEFAIGAFGLILDTRLPAARTFTEFHP
jgi:hypothetical protein